MEKKLPNVYANKITKELKNNEKIHITKRTDNLKENLEEKTSSDEIIKLELSNKQTNIENTIKEIMKLKKNKYKIPVEITIEEDTVIKNIIGKNNKYLITIENELIPIKDIKYIKIKTS